MADAIHIHEDDRRMRNLYPLVTRAEVEADMDESIAAAERNRAPSGPGYTAMHQIEPPSLDYAELGLTLVKRKKC